MSTSCFRWRAPLFPGAFLLLSGCQMRARVSIWKMGHQMEPLMEKNSFLCLRRTSGDMQMEQVRNYPVEDLLVPQEPHGVSLVSAALSDA
ncbi:hypothetical protein AVEN_160190-1 [Araneus ventricosus]|uniref:Uncharacterized protein n=1 Tax=Araneus ventricosus TaxID=182803 RepID=A0A4Y2PII0_ARAVE|nr:hypothetical protein AVEN_160190-1 [Araneus ventricosus]